MSGETIRAGGAFYEILVDDNSKAGLDAAGKEFQKYQREVEKANKAIEKSFKDAGERVKMLGRGLAVAGAALTAFGAAGIASLGAATREFMDFGSTINDFSARTGVSTDWAQSFKVGAELAGSSLGAVESAIKKMQLTLAKTGKLQGMKPEEQFAAIAAEIAGISDPAQKTAAAVAMFGKSGAQLIPMLESLATTKAFLQNSGLLLSPEDVKLADELGDAFDLLKLSIGQVVRIAGAALAPMILSVVQSLASGVAVVGQFINENRGLVKAIAAGLGIIGALGSALTIVGGGIIFAGSILGALPAIVAAATTAMGVFSAVLGAVLSPIGLVVASVAALVALLPAFAYVMDANFFGGAGLKFLADSFKELWAIASQTLGGIMNALSAGKWQLAGAIAGQGLTVAFTTLWGFIRVGFADLWLWVIGKAMAAMDKLNLLVLQAVRATFGPINDLLAASGQNVGFSNEDLDLTIEDAKAKTGRRDKEFQAAGKAVRMSAAAETRKEQDKLDALVKLAEAPRKDKISQIAAATAIATPQAFKAQSQQVISTGATSSAAVARLAMNQPVFEKIEEHLENHTTLLERVADNTEDMGQEFDD